MSDYLSDLAARNLGTAEVVQPRLASRFEPAMPGGALVSAPPVFDATDELDGLAESSPETMTAPETREQRYEPVRADQRPSVVSHPARLVVDEMEPQSSSLPPAPNAQSTAPATSVTPTIQPATKSRRSESVTPMEARPEAVWRPAHSTAEAAASAQPSGQAGAPVFQSDAPAQTPVHTPSRPTEHGFDEQIRAAVDAALALQRARSNDGAAQLDRKRTSSVIGMLSNHDVSAIDERTRWSIEGVLARQHNGKGAEEPATTSRSVQNETIAEHPASRPNASRAESTTAIKPAVLARAIAQPQIASALAVLPGSPARTPVDTLHAQPELQSPPTIQVTIGRIEVRATPAPTATTTGKSRQAPVVSLDDYLRQRNRGGQ